MSKNNVTVLLLLYFCLFLELSFAKKDLTLFSFSEEENQLEDAQIKRNARIDNAIYVIRNYNKDKNLDIEANIPTFINYPKKTLKKHFRFIAVDKNTNKPTDIIKSENYFCIEDKDYHQRLGIKDQTGSIGLYAPPNDKASAIDDICLWKIFPKIIENNLDNKKYKAIYYYIQNKANGNYLTYVDINNKGILECNAENINQLTNNNYFILNKMYREKIPNESLDIINKEPIDVLIKYIDLSDPNLKREGISQIKKDEDNGEITYCVRSILKNIPWVRKIFILMPNEKVKYFKDPKDIKERIVYVKDKDLIGFDSASSPVFQFNLWKMKKFGLSENFILMDDDYFIGKPLKKSNFFYEENGEVYPASITGDYYEMNKKNLENSLKPLLAKIAKTGAHSPNGFSIMQKSSLLFLFDIFGDDNERNGQPLIEAAFSHNAIPVKQSDIKEIYDFIVDLYPYADDTLKAKIRHIRSLQPQTLFLSYPKNKYDRRVKIVRSRFFDLSQFKGNVDTELFVINTSDKKYISEYYRNEITKLDQLFPEKSPYEIGSENTIKEEPKKNVDEVNSKENKASEPEKKNENTHIEKTNLENKKRDSILYEEIFNYLSMTLDNKKNIENEMLKIREQINILSEKYEKAEIEIGELANKINNIIQRNLTFYKSQTENITGYKYLEVLILVIIFIVFILYLYNKGYFSGSYDNNYYEDNEGFGNLNKEKELSLINSKLDMQ